MKRLLFLFSFLVSALVANGASTDANNVQLTQRNAAGTQWVTKYLAPGSQITTWAEFAAAIGAGTFDPTAVVGSKTWSNGSTDTFVWTFNPLTGVDPTITFGNGVINLSALAIAGTTVTPTATELNLVDGVTSSIQTQLDARLSTANNFSEIAAAGGAAQTSARANLLLGSSDAVAFGSGTFTSGIFSNVRVWTRDAGNITTTLALANTDSLVEATFTDQAAAITLPALPDDGRRILVIGHNTDNGGALVLSIPDGLYNPNRDTDTATSSTTLTIPASSSGTFLLGFVADDTGWLLYDSVGDTFSTGAPSDATFITQTANGTLSAEQALSALPTGIMRVATTTGVITSLTDSAGIQANLSDETGTGGLVGANSPTFVDDILLSTAGVLLTGDGDGAITMAGQGDGNDENLIWNFDDGSANTVALTSGTSVTSIDTGTVGLDMDSATTRVGAFQTTDTKLLHQALSAYGAGTAYAFTNTAAAIDLGTTDPVKVIDSVGTYLIFAQVHMTYTAATVATETATIKVRRTNNTAADLSAVVVIDLPSSTVVTNSYGVVQIPPFTYTTAATDDSLTIFANVSAALSAGSIDATAIGTSILAVRLY